MQEQVRLEIEKLSILRHPFYQLWSNGKLSLEALRVYAKQYYHFVNRFPGFLESILENCSDPTIRGLISENLSEERMHPSLWLTFANSLGLLNVEVVTSEKLSETTESLRDFEALMSESTLKAAASLLAYEAQVPEVAKQKMEGLHRFYGIQSPQALEYFRVHTEVDLEHVKVWERILGEELLPNEVVEAIQTSLRAQWKLLDGVIRVCQLDKLCETPTMS